MLWHVLQGVLEAKGIDEVWVLTDSEEVFKAVHSWGAKAKMTPVECNSGTERIVSVLSEFNADIIVNVQGDEPLIQSYVVDDVVSALGGSDAGVATPIYRIDTADEIFNPNVVKVVRAADGKVLIFSRSPVPHVRDFPQEEWPSKANFWGHVGVYAYRREVLERYRDLPTGSLEGVEKLEQMRFLEAGVGFVAVEIDYRPHAVDVPADLEEVRKILEGKVVG